MHDVLGYERYAVRGSDLGGNVVRQIALRHPGHVIGVHLTGMIGADGATPPFTAAEQAFIDADAATLPERAYARLQMSKPQTLAHALNDSPVGLAAWIVEKFRAWSDSKGDVESRFSKDALLTNVTVYWVTGTAPASVRMYYDFSREPVVQGRIRERAETPDGCAPLLSDRRAVNAANGRFFYLVDLPASPSITVGVGVVGVAPRQGASVDIDGNGSDEQFAHCTTSEGISFGAWAGTPYQSEKLWSGYEYLGYDVDANCPP